MVFHPLRHCKFHRGPFDFGVGASPLHSSALCHVLSGASGCYDPKRHQLEAARGQGGGAGRQTSWRNARPLRALALYETESNNAERTGQGAAPAESWRRWRCRRHHRRRQSACEPVERGRAQPRERCAQPCPRSLCHGVSDGVGCARSTASASGEPVLGGPLLRTPAPAFARTRTRAQRAVRRARPLP